MGRLASVCSTSAAKTSTSARCFARGDLPSKESVRGVLGDIFDRTTKGLPIGSDIKRSLVTQGKDFDIRATTLANIYAQLELTHDLIRATTPIYTKYSFKAGTVYHQKINTDKSPEALAVKGFATKASTLFHIDIDAAANRFGIPRTDIIRKLNDLNETGALELKPSGVINVYKITNTPPKSHHEIEKITKSIYDVMAKREQEALLRTEQMLALITGKACFTKALAQHFGDSLPDGKKECGHCTWCMSHTPVVQQIPPPVPFNHGRFQAILNKVPDRDDARLLARIAFGIASPRSTAMKLSRDPVFGSMDDHNFEV